MQGRIQNSSLPYSAKFPVLLPKKQHFTRLVIAQSYENVKHNGVRETLTETRAQFWIIKGRQAVKDVLSKCITCKKKLKGEPRTAIQIGDLVHVYADKTPRQQWRMGKVENLLRGRDNVCSRRRSGDSRQIA